MSLTLEQAVKLEVEIRHVLKIGAKPTYKGFFEFLPRIGSDFGWSPPYWDDENFEDEKERAKMTEETRQKIIDYIAEVRGQGIYFAETNGRPL